jgi:hypothetical protein
MTWRLAELLALGLALNVAGCAELNFARQEPANVAAPTERVVPAPTGHVLSAPKPIPHRPSAARAMASKPDAKDSTNKASLMECVSAACKTQCAPGMDNRPKWCMYFREPIDRHADSATPDARR